MKTSETAQIPDDGDPTERTTMSDAKKTEARHESINDERRDRAIAFCSAKGGQQCICRWLLQFMREEEPSIAAKARRAALSEQAVERADRPAPAQATTCDCPIRGAGKGSHCRAERFGFKWTSDDWCGCKCHETPFPAPVEPAPSLVADREAVQAMTGEAERGEALPERFMRQFGSGRDVHVGHTARWYEQLDVDRVAAFLDKEDRVSRAQVAKLEAENAELRASARDRREHADKLTASLLTAETQVAALQSELASANAWAKKLEEQNSIVDAENAGLRQERNELLASARGGQVPAVLKAFDEFREVWSDYTGLDKYGRAMLAAMSTDYTTLGAKVARLCMAVDDWRRLAPAATVETGEPGKGGA